MIKTYIANQPRREVKNGIQARKAEKRAALRESHANMTLEGIERRRNGGKLGHRRRIQMLRDMIATW